MHRESPIATLIRFAQHVANAESPAGLMPLLAEAAVVHLKADGAVVVEITSAGTLRVAASQRTPSVQRGAELDAEGLDGELEAEIVRRCEGLFASARVLPLISGRAIFGGLVLLSAEAGAVDLISSELADGFVTITALSLERRFRLSELEQALAQTREAQDTLVRTEKLRALGQMSAGISHDLRNLLSPLSLRVGVLKRRLKDQPEALGQLIEIEHTLSRGVELMERMRQFSRQDKNERAENCDLKALVHDAIELSRARLVGDSARVKLVADLGDTPLVELRAGELVSAVVNLIVNAVEAIGPRAGTITVRSGGDARGAWVQVADTGPGVPEEVREHLFEPFFTTKGEAGTGLGLSNIYAFVQRRGGRIDVQTGEGTGCLFTLWFPRASVGHAVESHAS